MHAVSRWVRSLGALTALAWALSVGHAADGASESDPTALRAEVVRESSGYLADLWFGRPCPGDIVVHLLTPRLHVRDTLRLQIGIFNVCRECKAEIPKDSHLVIREDRPDDENSCFVSASVPLLDGILCHSNAVVNATLQTKVHVSSIAALPAKLRVEIVDANGDRTRWGSAIIDFPFYAYRPMFASSGREYNILLVGFPGAGKSTYIMSSAAALQPGIEQELPRDIGQRKGHNTRSITKYDLSSMVGDSKLRIKLWDTWGICEGACSSKDFSTSFLRNLADGSVPDGYRLSEYDVEHDSFRNQTSQAFGSDDRMHAVVFVLKAEEAQREPERSLARKYIGQIQDLGYKTMVIVTWLHHACGSNNTQACESHQLSKIARIFEIPLHTVYAFTRGAVNLRSHKDSEVGKYALSILEVARNNADEHYAKLRGMNPLKDPQAVEAPSQGMPILKDTYWRLGKQLLKLVLDDCRVLATHANTYSLFELSSPVIGLGVLLVLLRRRRRKRRLISQPHNGDSFPVHSENTYRSSISEFLVFRVPAEVPDRRRRETQVPKLAWERVALLIPATIMVGAHFDIDLQMRVLPPDWRTQMNSDCARDMSVRIGEMLRVSDAECKVSCQVHRDCMFYSFGSQGCQLYKQCNGIISRREVHLNEKILAPLWELCPQVAINVVAAVCAGICGLLFVLTSSLFAATCALLLVVCGVGSNFLEVSSAAALGLQRSSLLRAMGLQAASAAVLFSLRHRQSESVDQILREEHGKGERLRELERQLWAEVRMRGNTAVGRYVHMSLMDLAVGFSIMLLIAGLVGYFASSVVGQNGLAGLSVASVLSRGILGVDSSRFMQACVVSLGVVFTFAPFLVGVKKVERGVLGLAYDPRDELGSAVESAAQHTLDVQEELQRRFRAAAIGGRNDDMSVEALLDGFGTLPLSTWEPRQRVDGQSSEILLEALESHVLRLARTRLREYAEALQVSPDALFNRDSLLDEEAEAVHNAAEKGKGFVRGIFDTTMTVVTGGAWYLFRSSRTTPPSSGSSRFGAAAGAGETNAAGVRGSAERSAPGDVPEQRLRTRGNPRVKIGDGAVAAASAS